MQAVLTGYYRSLGVTSHCKGVRENKITTAPLCTGSASSPALTAALLPIRGTASLVLGITELTMFINTVKDNRIVTPE